MDYLDKITQDKSRLAQLVKTAVKRDDIIKAGFFLDKLYETHFKEYLYYCSLISRLKRKPCNSSIQQNIQELKDSKKDFLIDFAAKQLTGRVLSQMPYKPL